MNRLFLLFCVLSFVTLTLGNGFNQAKVSSSPTPSPVSPSSSSLLSLIDSHKSTKSVSQWLKSPLLKNISNLLSSCDSNVDLATALPFLQQHHPVMDKVRSWYESILPKLISDAAEMGHLPAQPPQTQTLKRSTKTQSTRLLKLASLSNDLTTSWLSGQGIHSGISVGQTQTQDQSQPQSQPTQQGQGQPQWWSSSQSSKSLWSNPEGEANVFESDLKMFVPVSLTVFMPTDAAFNASIPKWNFFISKYYNSTVDIVSVLSSPSNYSSDLVELVSVFWNAGMASIIVPHKANLPFTRPATWDSKHLRSPTNSSALYSRYLRSMNNDASLVNLGVGESQVLHVLSSPKDIFVYSGSHRNTSAHGRARVVEKDLCASNGVLHLLDSVPRIPMPPSAELLKANFTKFMKIVQQANMTQFIDSQRSITIVAPTDQAIQMWKQQNPNLFKRLAENNNQTNQTNQLTYQQQLQKFVKMHLFKGVFYTQFLSNVSGLECYSGAIHGVSVSQSADANQSQTQNSNELVSIGEAPIILPNLLTWSGVIQGVGGVLTDKKTVAATQQPVHKLCDSKSLSGQPADVSMFSNSSVNSSCPIEGEQVCNVISPQTLTSLCSTAQVKEESLKSVSLVSVCYSPSSHKCVGGYFLCPLSYQSECGGLCYSEDSFTCQTSNSTIYALCPKGYQLCGSQTCFNPQSFDCQEGILILKSGGQVNAVAPTAISYQPTNQFNQYTPNQFFGRVVANATKGNYTQV